MAVYIWPEAMTTQLVDLWNVQRLSAKDAAAILGVTRSAVLGKVKYG